MNEIETLRGFYRLVSTVLSNTNMRDSLDKDIALTHIASFVSAVQVMADEMDFPLVGWGTALALSEIADRARKAMPEEAVKVAQA